MKTLTSKTYPSSLSLSQLLVKSSLDFELILTISSHLQAIFVKLSIHINHLHLNNIKDMTIICFYQNLSCICNQLLHIGEQCDIFLLTPFSTINNAVKRSNFTLVVLRLLAMLSLVQYENEKGQVHIFQDKYFKKSQIHLLTIMYYFEHINHDIALKNLFACV